MKVRLVVALVGLAISFALPTFAQTSTTWPPSPRSIRRTWLGRRMTTEHNTVGSHRESVCKVGIQELACQQLFHHDRSGNCGRQ